MSQHDGAQLTQVVKPPPIFADFNTGPGGIRTLTVNLSSVFPMGAEYTYNGQPPSGGSGGKMSEQFIADLAGRVGRIETAITGITGDVSSLKSDMKHVATKTWILWGVIVTLLGVFGSVAGGIAWLVQQYLGPIMANLAH